MPDIYTQGTPVHKKTTAWTDTLDTRLFSGFVHHQKASLDITHLILMFLVFQAFLQIVAEAANPTTAASLRAGMPTTAQNLTTHTVSSTSAAPESPICTEVDLTCVSTFSATGTAVIGLIVGAAEAIKKIYDAFNFGIAFPIRLKSYVFQAGRVYTPYTGDPINLRTLSTRFYPETCDPCGRNSARYQFVFGSDDERRQLAQEYANKTTTCCRRTPKYKVQLWIDKPADTQGELTTFGRNIGVDNDNDGQLAGKMRGLLSKPSVLIIVDNVDPNNLGFRNLLPNNADIIFLSDEANQNEALPRGYQSQNLRVTKEWLAGHREQFLPDGGTSSLITVKEIFDLLGNGSAALCRFVLGHCLGNGQQLKKSLGETYDGMPEDENTDALV